MNKFILILSVFLTGLLLTGCTLGVENDERALTVYTDRHYDTDQELFDQFTEETGIAVNVVKAGSDELINRLRTEGADTAADVFIVADAGRLHQAKENDLLQAVESDVITANVPANYRDVDNQWFGLTVRARVIVFHPDRVSEDDLSTYEDLTDPKWNGRVVVRSSANIYNQSLIASFLSINGESATRSFIAGLVANFARTPEGNDRDQAKAVMAGLADVAIMNTYYMGKMANSSDPYEVEVANALRVFFPNQDTTGTHVNISGAAVTKHSDNVAEAVAFIEFLTSPTAQALFAEANYEYPVNPDVDAAELLESWGDFIAQDIPLTDLGTFAQEATILMDEEGWN